MKNRMILFVVLLCISAMNAGCQKDALDDGEMVYLNVAAPSMTGPDSDADTRVAFGGTTFMQDINGSYMFPYYLYLGVCVNKNGSLTIPHTDGYFNMNSKLTSASGGANRYDTWYFPIGGNTDYSRIPLYKNQGNVDVYSYYPYNADVTDLTRVPFDVTLSTSSTPGSTSMLTDYLAMTPITNIDPTVSSQLSRTFVYKHVMTLLSFATVFNFPGYYYVGKIRIETADGGAWIPIRGTYNAVTGVVNSGYETASSLELTYNDVQGSNTENSTSNLRYYAFMFPEILTTSSATNRKLKVTFMFNSTSSTPIENFGGPFILDLASLRPSISSTEYGLKQGYRYDIPVNVDDYIYFSPFEVNITPWTNQTVDIII